MRKVVREVKKMDGDELLAHGTYASQNQSFSHFVTRKSEKKEEQRVSWGSAFMRAALPVGRYNPS